METTPDELNAWLGKESGKPVHVATQDADLTAELKRGLSFIRHEKPEKTREGNVIVWTDRKRPEGSGTSSSLEKTTMRSVEAS